MEEHEKSSTGLDENVAGFLCYLFGFISGIIFLIIEKRSGFVKFHARQSTLAFLSLFVISMILGMIPIINLLLLPLWILVLALWLLLMIKALQGKRYALPIVQKWLKGQETERGN